MFNVSLPVTTCMGNRCSPGLSLLMSLTVSYFVLSFVFHEISWMRSGTK